MKGEQELCTQSKELQASRGPCGGRSAKGPRRSMEISLKKLSGQCEVLSREENF